jgi:cellulose synthase/poly-beta-1,6-N-acetylglucosamine synthase-like glycosyltransferase
VGKGYALDELLQFIARDWGSDAFDGYFVFDADNLLEPDYVRQMDRTFRQGYRVITSYRNSKNYGDNWISAGYALWFLREARYLNRPRMRLGCSCAVSGTGFFFSREVLSENGGWPFHLLTEDIEFTVDRVLRGEKIGYCEDAVFYDEQPTSFRQSWRQRLRWAKGYLQVFRRYGFPLLWGTLRGRFSCFDMTMAILPAIVLTLASTAVNLTAAILGTVTAGSPGEAVPAVLSLCATAYLTLFFLGTVTLASEWKRIYAPTYKKLLSALTFPLFMLTYAPISLAALFCRVTWKPITHKKSLSLSQIRPKKSA